MSRSQHQYRRIVERNCRFIPGGISSTNRVINPPLAFRRAHGAWLWDTDDKRYIDFHGAFAPHFLGHNFEPVNQAATDVLRGEESLFGAGFADLEGQLAELVCTHVSAADKVTLLNTGSEATSLAVRIARAITGRSHIIVMQGGYNGNHDELACNVFNSKAEVGPRVSPGEYRVMPLGAGSTLEYARVVHPINFNDLDSVRYVCRRYPVAALITEPVLQNIGVVKPVPGYLAGLRALADEMGFALIFDEVKTGFRHALGGYTSLADVRPDLITFGKAIANGFPLALVGGKSEFMDCIIDPDPLRRPLVAGTYNGHPVAVAAAIATIRYLAGHQREVYEHVEALGSSMEEGMREIFARHGVAACVARQGSAFAFYFMSEPPRDFHDILEHHDFERDVRLRRALIERGVFFIPIATKQCSLSAAHQAADVQKTLESLDDALASMATR